MAAYTLVHILLLGLWLASSLSASNASPDNVSSATADLGKRNITFDPVTFLGMVGQWRRGSFETAVIPDFAAECRNANRRMVGYDDMEDIICHKVNRVLYRVTCRANSSSTGYAMRGIYWFECPLSMDCVATSQETRQPLPTMSTWIPGRKQIECQPVHVSMRQGMMPSHPGPSTWRANRIKSPPGSSEAYGAMNVRGETSGAPFSMAMDATSETSGTQRSIGREVFTGKDARGTNHEFTVYYKFPNKSDNYFFNPVITVNKTNTHNLWAIAAMTFG